LLDRRSYLRASDPQLNLQRGYALVYAGKKLISSVNNLENGQIIRTIMSDGWIDSEVKKG